MLTVDRDELPKDLLDTIVSYEGIIGAPATVESMDAGQYRVTYADTDRVRCFVDYATTTSGRASEWFASELWIDGVRRQLCRGPQDLAKLLRNPGAFRLAEHVSYDADGLDNPANARRVPAIVLHHYRLVTQRVAHRIGGVAGEVRVEQDTPGSWRIRVSVDDVVVVLHFFRPGGNGWALDKKESTVLIGGLAHSGEFSQGIDMILLLLGGNRQVPTTGPSGVDHAAPAARQGSVEVRRASVIRV